MFSFFKPAILATTSVLSGMMPWGGSLHTFKRCEVTQTFRDAKALAQHHVPQHAQQLGAIKLHRTPNMDVLLGAGLNMVCYKDEETLGKYLASLKELEFGMLHELGHHVEGHVELAKTSLEAILFISRQREIEADLFAAEVGGPSVARAGARWASRQSKQPKNWLSERLCELLGRPNFMHPTYRERAEYLTQIGYRPLGSCHSPIGLGVVTEKQVEGDPNFFFPKLDALAYSLAVRH